MLQFGYNTGVINAPGKNIENFIKDVFRDRQTDDITEEFVQSLRSLVVSIFAIGGMVGGFMGGWISNRFGRYEHLRKCIYMVLSIYSCMCVCLAERAAYCLTMCWASRAPV